MTQDEETRKVDFVSFPVEATEKDKAAIAEQIAKLQPAFKATTDDSTFVQNNFGSISQFWVKQADVLDIIRDTLAGMSAGSVYGPYVDKTAYKAVKILDKQVMRDSADSRHILIPATTPAEFAEADARIDSLKNVIERGLNLSLIHI